MKNFKQRWPIDVVLKKVRIYVDKYARIEKQKIVYSTYDPSMKRRVKKVLSFEEARKIFEELYDEKN